MLYRQMRNAQQCLHQSKLTILYASLMLNVFFHQPAAYVIRLRSYCLHTSICVTQVQMLSATRRDLAVVRPVQHHAGLVSSVECQATK